MDNAAEIENLERKIEQYTADMDKKNGNDCQKSEELSPSAKISKNVEHIEALLKRINEENKKTKQVRH